MAQAYFEHNRHLNEAVFHLFLRKNPFNGNWTLACGIQDALDFIGDFRFDEESIAFLQSLSQNERPIFSEKFLHFLSSSDARVSVYGVQDGDIVFPHEPIIRVQGPLFLCQLLETPLLNIINFQSLIATKAARITLAAHKKPLIDFGMRRAQGFGAAIAASKAAYIGGITATSNPWATKHFAIPQSGTMAHSFVMSYPDELKAFDAFSSVYPHRPVLLIDTYDPYTGIKNAITTFKTHNPKACGIRIDSGNLLTLSFMARKMLDEAGLNVCSIIVSGDLDEYAIEKLEKEHAPIDAYGVGTKLITAFEEPSLGGVYKLVAMCENGVWRDTYKKSASIEKATRPGPKSIQRFLSKGKMVADYVFDSRMDSLATALSFDQQISLHTPLIEKGVLLQKPLSLSSLREYARNSIESIPENLMDLKKSPMPYPIYFCENNNESIAPDRFTK